MPSASPTAVPTAVPTIEAQLRDLLARRILILDGAMGTMIQRYKLVRGGLPWRTLCRPPGRRARQQRAAAAHAADGHPGDPRAVPGRRRGPDRDQHLRRHLDRAGGLPDGAPGLRDEPRGRAGSRKPPPPSTPPPTSRVSSPARSDPRPRPRRSRPTSTTPAHATSPSTSSSRPTASRRAACSMAAPTCCWSRRSSTRSTPRRRSSRSRQLFAERGARCR